MKNPWVEEEGDGSSTKIIEHMFCLCQAGEGKITRRGMGIQDLETENGKWKDRSHNVKKERLEQ